MREESNRLIQGMERRRRAEKEQRDENLRAMRENADYTERALARNQAIEMENLKNEEMQKIANIQGTQKQAEIDAAARQDIMDSLMDFSQTVQKVAAERTAQMIKDQTALGLSTPIQNIDPEVVEQYIDATQQQLSGGIALDTEIAANGVLTNESQYDTYKGYVSNHGFKGYAARANDNKVAVRLYNQLLNKRLQSVDKTFVAANGTEFSGIEALSNPEFMAQLQQQTRKDLSSFMGFTDPMYLADANKAIDESDAAMQTASGKEGIKKFKAVIKQQATDMAGTGTVEGVTGGFARIKASEGAAAAHDWYQENVIANPDIPEEVARAPDLMGNGKDYSQEWSSRWEAGIKKRNAAIVKAQNAEEDFKKAEDAAWVNANIDSIIAAYDENPLQAAMLVKQRYFNKGMTVPPVIAAIEREAIKENKEILENLVAQKTKFGNLDLPFINGIPDATLQKTALAAYEQQELRKYGDKALGIKKQLGALAKKRTGFDPSAEGNSPTTFLLTAAMTKRYVDNVKSLKDPLTAWTATQKQIEAERNDPSALFYEDPKGGTNNKPFFPNIETSPRERVEMNTYIDKELLRRGRALVDKPFALANSFEMDAAYTSSLSGVVKYPPGIIRYADSTGVKPSEAFNAQRQANNLVTGDNKPLLAPSPAAMLVDNAPPAMRKLFLSDVPEQINRGSAMVTGQLPRRNTFKVSQTAIYGNAQQIQALDTIALTESGGSGYDAVNQGGSDGGKKTLGYSGAYSQMPTARYKVPLTEMTLGQVLEEGDPRFSTLNTKQFQNAGGIHAAGRYQIINSTLRGLVEKHNLPLNAKFSPELQDFLALSLLNSGGDGQWVGPKDSDRDIIKMGRGYDLGEPPLTY